VSACVRAMSSVAGDPASSEKALAQVFHSVCEGRVELKLERCLENEVRGSFAHAVRGNTGGAVGRTKHLARDDRRPPDNKDVRDRSRDVRDARDRDRDRDRDLRDREARDREYRDREIRDRELRDRELRDRELRERVHRERDREQRELEQRNRGREDARDRLARDPRYLPPTPSALPDRHDDPYARDRRPPADLYGTSGRPHYAEPYMPTGPVSPVYDRPRDPAPLPPPVYERERERERDRAYDDRAFDARLDAARYYTPPTSATYAPPPPPLYADAGDRHQGRGEPPRDRNDRYAQAGRPLDYVDVSRFNSSAPVGNGHTYATGYAGGSGTSGGSDAERSSRSEFAAYQHNRVEDSRDPRADYAAAHRCLPMLCVRACM
jgi:hypothetical protein